jgi:hypothetical protein
MTAESSTEEEVDPRISRILNFFMDSGRLERYQREFSNLSGQPESQQGRAHKIFECYSFIRDYYHSLNEEMLVATAKIGMLYVSDNTAEEKREMILNLPYFDLRTLSDTEHNRTIDLHYRYSFTLERQELRANIIELLNISQRDRENCQILLKWMVAIGSYYEILTHPTLQSSADILGGDGLLGETNFLGNMEVVSRSSEHKTLDIKSSKSFQRAIFYVLSQYANNLIACAPLKDKIPSVGAEYLQMKKIIERMISAMSMLFDVPHWHPVTMINLFKILESLKETKVLSMKATNIVDRLFEKFSEIMKSVDPSTKTPSIQKSFEILKKSFNKKQTPIDNTSLIPKHLLVKKPARPLRLSKKKQAAMRRKEKEKSIAERPLASNQQTAPLASSAFTSSASEMLTSVGPSQAETSSSQSMSDAAVIPLKSASNPPVPSSSTARKKRKKQNRLERSKNAALLLAESSQQKSVAEEPTLDLSTPVAAESSRETSFLAAGALLQQDFATEVAPVLSSEILAVEPIIPLTASLLEEGPMSQDEQSNIASMPPLSADMSDALIPISEINAFTGEETSNLLSSVCSSSETVSTTQILEILPEQQNNVGMVILESVAQPDAPPSGHEYFSTELTMRIEHLNAWYLQWYQAMQQQVALRQQVMKQHAEFSQWVAEQTNGQSVAPPQDNVAGVLIDPVWAQYYQQQYAQAHASQSSYENASTPQTSTATISSPYTIAVPEAIKNIMIQLGPRCYLVGGATRNLLLGKRARDFDLVTDASEDAILSLGGKPVVSRYPELYSLEIEVEPGVKTIVDIVRKDGVLDTALDAKLRDFTVNAIYFDYKSGIFMPLSNSSYDLHYGIVRLIAKENDFSRIRRDPTLILRALSLVAHHGFQLEKNLSHFLMTEGIRILWHAMQKNKKALMNEVWKGFATGDALRFYQELQRFGYVSQLFPQAWVNICQTAYNQSFENNLYNMLAETSQLPPSKRSRKILFGRVFGCSEELLESEVRDFAVESKAFELQNSKNLLRRNTP